MGWRLNVTLVLGALTSAIVSCRTPTANLELAFPQGVRVEYRTNGWNEATSDQITYTDGPFRVETSGRLFLEGVEVDDHGVATIHETSGETTLRYPGQPARVLPPTTRTIEVGPDARIHAVEVHEGSVSDLLIFPPLPSHGVKPRDSWTFDYEIPLEKARGSVRMQGQSTLARLEEKDGMALAVIESDLMLSTDAGLNILQEMSADQSAAMLAQGWDPAANVHITVAMNGTSTATIDIASRRIASLSAMLAGKSSAHYTDFPPGYPTDTEVATKTYDDIQLVSS